MKKILLLLFVLALVLTNVGLVLAENTIPTGPVADSELFNEEGLLLIFLGDTRRIHEAKMAYLATKGKVEKIGDNTYHFTDAQTTMHYRYYKDQLCEITTASPKQAGEKETLELVKQIELSYNKNFGEPIFKNESTGVCGWRDKLDQIILIPDIENRGVITKQTYMDLCREENIQKAVSLFSDGDFMKLELKDTSKEINKKVKQLVKDEITRKTSNGGLQVGLFGCDWTCNWDYNEDDLFFRMALATVIPSEKLTDILLREEIIPALTQVYGEPNDGGKGQRWDMLDRNLMCPCIAEWDKDDKKISIYRAPVKGGNEFIIISMYDKKLKDSRDFPITLFRAGVKDEKDSETTPKTEAAP